MDTRKTFQPQFGKYILTKLLAKGGMAEIFRAIACGPEGFRKISAIKRILPHFSSDGEYVRMFIDEAKMVSNLNHPNIVEIYEFGKTDDRLFISMEYVQGKSLFDLTSALRAAETQLPFELAGFVFEQALAGLEGAHNHRSPLGHPLNIIHRDLSPQNLLVSYSGDVKIADFGVAKASGRLVHTQVGIVKGNIRYMSPEHICGQPLTQRSDIFTLALTLSELLTLKPLRSETNEDKLSNQVRDGIFTRPRKINDRIPRSLEGVLLKALEVDPGKRFASASEFREALLKVLDKKGLRSGSSKSLSEFLGTMFRKEIEYESKQIAEEFRSTERFMREALETTQKIQPLKQVSSPESESSLGEDKQNLIEKSPEQTSFRERTTLTQAQVPPSIAASDSHASAFPPEEFSTLELPVFKSVKSSPRKTSDSEPPGDDKNGEEPA